MGQTSAELQIRLAGLVSEVFDLAPSGNYANNAFDCAAVSAYGSDYFNDWYGRVYDGSLMGTNFDVTDFATTTGRFSVSPAAASTFDAQDKFYVCQDFRAEELIRALNEAISMAKRDALEEKVDETLVMKSAVYEYRLPSGFEYIHSVIKESGTAGVYSESEDEVDFSHWQILHRSGGPILWFDKNLYSPTADRHIRLMGQATPALLASDDQVCNVGDAWLIQQAKALLHQSRILGRGADFEEHEAQMRLAQAMADRLRPSIRVLRRGEQVPA